MPHLHAWFRRLLGLFQRRRVRCRNDRRNRQHLDGLIERNRAAGMSPNEARDKALKQFGGVEQIKDSPGSSACGCGTSSGKIWLSLVAAPANRRVCCCRCPHAGSRHRLMSRCKVLFTPSCCLSFLPEANRLVAISETWTDGISPMSYPDYLDWKAARHSFDEIAVAS